MQRFFKRDFIDISIILGVPSLPEDYCKSKLSSFFFYNSNILLNSIFGSTFSKKVAIRSILSFSTKFKIIVITITKTKAATIINKIVFFIIIILYILYILIFKKGWFFKIIFFIAIRVLNSKTGRFSKSPSVCKVFIGFKIKYDSNNYPDKQCVLMILAN